MDTKMKICEVCGNVFDPHRTAWVEMFLPSKGPIVACGEECRKKYFKNTFGDRQPELLHSRVETEGGN